MKIYRLVFVLFLFMFCSQYENPFTDTSKAKMNCIQNRSSFDTKNVDSALIFTTETLVVAATVYELIDSFTISTAKNRFWTKKAINNPTSEHYPFYLSFYDTGYQTISLATFRSNGDKPVEDITIYVSIPLKQNDLAPQSSSDSILLSTFSVGDKEQIVYNWLFGEGGELIRSPYPSIKTVISDNINTNGLLWVSDTSYKSPAVPFSFSFYDSTPPVILCLNDNFDKTNNTIFTSDTVFTFMARITDNGNQPVNLVEINGIAQAFKRTNVYTSSFTNMNLHTSNNPLKITIKTVDNNAFNNDTAVSFLAVFDPSAAHQGTTIVKITSMGDSSISTSRNLFNIFGTVENTNNQLINLSLYLNDVHQKDTTVIGFGSWNCLLTLREGINNFYLICKNEFGSKLDSQAVTIIYHRNTVDNSAPVIILKEINDRLIINEYKTDRDSVQLAISAYDAGSGIQKFIVGKDTLFVNENTYQHYFTLRNLHHNRNTIRIQVSDHKGNSIKDSITIIQNTLPTAQFQNSIPYVVYTQNSYNDTLKMYDKEDSVNLTIIKRPGSMIFEKINNFAYSIKWKPELNDTTRSLIFQLRDGIDASPLYTYDYAVFDPSSLAPTITISDQIAMPSFLEAVNDTLKCIIKTDANTGNKPFTYTVDILNKSENILDNSTDSLIIWTPKETDTGNVELRIIVEDSLKFRDTLFRSILVVNQNKYASKIFWNATKDTVAGGKLFLKKTDTVFVNFTIEDADNPLTEKHLVTLTSQGQVTNFQAQTENFTVKLYYANESYIDTLQVVVKDNTGTTDKVAIPVYYNIPSPDMISDLHSSFDHESVVTVTNTQKVDFWSSTGDHSFQMDNINNFSDINVNNYALNGYSAVGFDGVSSTLFNSEQGKLFNGPLTVFFVCKYNSIAPNNHVLLSTSDFFNNSNFNSTIGFGVIKDGKAGILSLNSNSGSPGVIDSKSSSLPVIADKWNIVSFSAAGIVNQRLTADISVNGMHDTISAPANNAPNLLFGGCLLNNPSFVWNGLIAEILIYNRILTFDERSMIEFYLQTKYRLDN